MENSKHLSVFAGGYMGNMITLKLAMNRIVCVEHIDNGFRAVEVSDNDLERSIELIKEIKNAGLINVSDTWGEATKYRSNYWNEIKL